MIVTAALPVDVSVNDPVAFVFTFTLPKLRLVALALSAAVPPLNCSEKTWVALPALAVRVTVVAVLTAVAVAVKLALVAPDATVTDEGTVTAKLLLARLTAKPPLAAAALTVTEQLSVPAPVIEPLVQPVPLRLTAVELPVEELLVKVNDPEAAPAAVGSNCTVSVAV
ncbi:MAG: hypothetical protein ABSD70_17285 [Terracidiphilus sp.]